MLIDPREAIENGWIKHPECDTIEDWESKSFLSPNAIDFTVDSVRAVHKHHVFQINEKTKKHRSSHLLNPVVVRDDINHWNLDVGIYDGVSDMYVTLPEGITATLIIRSTLNRNGVFLKSGLYDSGFKGNIGFVIYNFFGVTLLGEHTRVGQIIFEPSSSNKLYKGGYNTEEGQHWSDLTNDIE